MPSQMKREVEEIHQQETPTPYSHPLTIATVEKSYPMTRTSEAQHRQIETLDSSLSASPTATTPQRTTNSNVQEAARAHVLPDDRSLASSGEFYLRTFLIIIFLILNTIKHESKKLLSFFIQIRFVCLNVKKNEMK
jgi:hypothetical protein